MRINLDRAAGTVAGQGIVVRVDPTGDVLRPWLMAAIREGWDFTGRPVEMWDCGSDHRRTAIRCLTVVNVATFLNPPKQKKKDPAA